MTEEIVISGIAGRFPESDSVDEFKELLFSNVDLVTQDERRWPLGLFGVPNRFGKMKELNKFDAQYFGISGHAVNNMDPQLRILLETSYEAIEDAGINPQTLRDSNTGVFIGVVVQHMNDLETMGANDTSFMTGYRLTGGCHTMFANHISFKFNFHGPSFAVSNGNNASFAALEQALLNIRNGVCDAAIVGTVNACAKPLTAFYLNSMELLSNDGKCKFLDESANGYARSEACTALFVQKKQNAFRNYASILALKSNNCGFIELSNATDSIIKSQSDLIGETLKEAGVKPSEIEFVEAYGSGTKNEDLIECKAISNNYCQNRLQPLLIGSVKTNMGHTEASSGLCSLIKVLLSFENQCIPANLHFNSPNTDITELSNGQLNPVVKNTRFTGEIVGINCFTTEGVNSHLIVKNNPNKLISYTNTTIPRLITICGRTEQSVNYIINFIEQNPDKITPEFLSLLNNVSKTLEPSNMFYRGYMLEKKLENLELIVYSKEISHINKRRQLWFAFSGLGSEWKSMGKWMLEIDNISNTLKKCSSILKQYGIDLYKIICNEDNTVPSLVSTTVSIISIQIALFDLFASLGINADGIVGHSIGELSCAYVDGCISLENVLHVTYWTAKCIQDANIPKGVMALIGLSYEEAKHRCPEGVDIGCHNTHDLVTISGEYNKVIKFLEELKADNIFTRILNSCDTALHSSLMNSIESSIVQCIEKYISSPVKRSDRWISTSVASNPWNEKRAKYFSAEYCANNIKSPVLLYEAIQNIPKDAIIIEMFSQSILKENLKSILGEDMTFIEITRKNNNDGNMDMLLTGIGKLYNLGFNANIENLYPLIQYPVSRGTQSIGSLIKWDHSQNWLVMLYPDYMNPEKLKNSEEIIDLQNSDTKYIKEFCIDNCLYVPTSAYLMMVWKFFSRITGKPEEKLAVEFKNVIIHRFEPIRSPVIPQKFVVELLTTNGEFIITENDVIIVTGTVFVLENDFINSKNVNKYQSKLTFTHNEIYKELSRRGYNFGERFQAINELNSDFSFAKIKWTYNWVTFVESMIQIAIFDKQTEDICLPLKFQYIRYNPEIVSQSLINNTMDVYYDSISNILASNGIEIKGLEFKFIPRNDTVMPDLLSDAFKQNDTNDDNLIETEHAFIDMTTVSHTSNMSDVRWYESSVKNWKSSSEDLKLCTVYYSSFNSNDILKNKTDLLSNEMRLCKEFVGRDEFGLRLMGLKISKQLSTTITLNDESVLWSIPDNWSMEESCTVPHAYATAYYALIVRGNLKSVDSVLIHCGNSSIGMAAISICLSLGCVVFTTVDNEEKREYLKKQFPQLNDKHFANCLDTSFEFDIKTATNYRGVDVVLNQLSENQLKSSLNCIAEHGRFLQIGKLDLTRDNPLHMSVFLKNIAFHGIVFEDLLTEQHLMTKKVLKQRQQVYDLIQNGINSGVVRPLNRRIITTNRIEHAINLPFNDVKTIIKIREQESQLYVSPKPLVYKAIRRTILNSNQTYILTEALNEFGFTLSEWLVKRGANKLILTTKNGTFNELQKHYITRLKQTGAEVIVCITDISSIEGTLMLINEAKRFGEIAGIFMVLNNNNAVNILFDDQSKNIEESDVTYVDGIVNLDSVSNQLPHLQYFVIFSFFECDNNNDDTHRKSNNISAIERLCASRQRNGFHGLSINFGDDKTSNIENGNEKLDSTLSQRIFLFLLNFDKYLHSKQSSINCIDVIGLQY